MRVLLTVGLAILGLGVPALTIADSRTCDSNSCQTEVPVGVSLIQTKPSKHHKSSDPAEKQDSTDLAEEKNEREGTQTHEVSAHAEKHHHTGLGKKNTRREDSKHHETSNRTTMNSTKTVHAGKHHHTGRGEADTKRKDSKSKVSRQLIMKSTQEVITGCVVSLFRDPVTDCQGPPGATYTTTMTGLGETFTPSDDDWASAAIGTGCQSVTLRDDDGPSRQQDMTVDGNAGCVPFDYDLKDDMNGVTAAATPTCTVELFRDGVVNCNGVAGATYSSSNPVGEEFTPADNDWASASVGKECSSVTFRDDDWSHSQQDVTVDGDAGCVRFEYDLHNDMKGVNIIAMQAVGR